MTGDGWWDLKNKDNAARVRCTRAPSSRGHKPVEGQKHATQRWRQWWRCTSRGGGVPVAAAGGGRGEDLGSSEIRALKIRLVGADAFPGSSHGSGWPPWRSKAHAGVSTLWSRPYADLRGTDDGRGYRMRRQMCMHSSTPADCAHGWCSSMRA